MSILTSIVNAVINLIAGRPLMKLVGMDSSLSSREALARELGYQGAIDGSADMNVWLHQKVTEQLASSLR